MSWLDRLKGSITLTSPDGDTFIAKWFGDPRTAKKKLGLFNYPKVDKQIAQDLGIAGITYPLTIAFDGPDNDLESTRFFEALKARGLWLIDHPTKGRLFLQPVSFKEEIAPLESGSITLFQTEWLDVALPDTVISVEQLSALVESQKTAVEIASLNQLVELSDQSTIENIQTIKSATKKSLDIYDQTIKPLADLSEAVSAQVEAIRRGIDDTLSSSPIDMTVLGGQIQALVRGPAVITGDVLEILQTYQDFIDKVLLIPTNAATRTDRNIIAIMEIFSISANESSNLISVRSKPITRVAAISSLTVISDQFIQITDALDVLQETYIDQLIENQYFSQSESFVESSIMSSQTIAFLLSISFDLAIEKRFTLKEDRAPIEITITEYVELGDNDSNFDLFIDTNDLKGNQILILPDGFEVVVYV